MNIDNHSTLRLTRYSANLASGQQGAVLIISLIILLIMTTIGVTALSTTTLEERMAQNHEHSELAFQASESGIESVISAGRRTVTVAGNTIDNPNYTSANDPILAAYTAGKNVSTVTRTYDMDPGGTQHNASLIATATITYRASLGLCPGQSDMSCDYYDISSTSMLLPSGATDTHVQGIQYMSPKAN